MHIDAHGFGVVIVGLGTIGSHVVPLLAQLPGIAHLCLVDHDRYERRNLHNQCVTPADIGQAKAVVQAERVRACHPALPVFPIVDRAEHLPLGVLRTGVLLSCVDSRATRVFLNEVCSRLATTWIDSGVHADGWLARVNAYVPGHDNPCLECAFDDRDYQLVEQTYPCAGDAAPRASGAPSALGALAAALQVLELEKLMAGRPEQAAIGRQVLIDTAWHTHYVTEFRRNPACRFDHVAWDVAVVDVGPEALIAGAAFALSERGDDPGNRALAVAGQVFVRRLTCPADGAARTLPWRLAGRLGSDAECRTCGGRMRAAGCDTRRWLSPYHLPSNLLAEPLATRGVRIGDIVTLRGPAGEYHFQLGGAAAARTASGLRNGE